MSAIVFMLLLFAVSASAQDFSEASVPFMLSTSTLRRGLVGYWRLEEASGTRYDFSKNGNHFTSSNSVGQAVGKVGYCATFVKTNAQCLVCPDSASLKGFTNMTIACWVNLTTVPGAGFYPCIVTKYTATVSGKKEYEIYFDGDIGNFSYITGTNATTGQAWAQANSAGLPTAGVWYFVCGWSDGTNNNISIDNTTLDATPNTFPIHQSTNPLMIGQEASLVAATLLNGKVDEVGIWNRVLSASEKSRLYNQGAGTHPPAFRGFVPSPNPLPLDISSPSSYQVVQRSGTTADILISGTLKGTHSIEAQFNGGSWVQITTNSTDTFSGTLPSQPQGQGGLSVRFADDHAVTASRNYVGVGDVFIVAGQSNAVGNGDNYQSYSGTFKASLFYNNYTWGECIDPTDSSTGQLDAISLDLNDPSEMGGSIWPLLATHFMTNQSCPIAFVPCAKDGSGMAAWQPSGSHTNRSNLYGSMVWRAGHAFTGGSKAVLWWQGETDAIIGTSTTSYYTYLTNLTANVVADLGVKLMPCKMENLAAATFAHNSNIWQAIGQAWTNDVNTLPGPDLSDLPSDPDAFNDHLRTDAHLQTAASRFWDSLKAAFYP